MTGVLKYPLLEGVQSDAGHTGRTRTESLTSGRTGGEQVGRQRYERSRAFFCMYPDGCARSACIDVICNAWFNNFVLGCIVLNAVTISMDDPLHSDGTPYAQRYTVEVLDNVFLGIFSLELIIKLIAQGGFLHRTAYFRDVWNHLDFLVVVSGVVSLASPDTSGLDALRVVRILRPLRTISRVRGMRDLVNTLGASLPILLNVMMLCFFLFFIFGLVGVITWSGALHNRCYGWSEEEQNFTYTTVCGNESMLDMFRVGCPEGRDCVSSAPSPNPWANWDHVGSSFLVVIQCLTLDDWVTHMYHVQDGWSPFAAVYFVVVTLIGAFFLLNLVLAVITDSFTRFAIEADDTELQPARETMQQRLRLQRSEQLEEPTSADDTTSIGSERSMGTSDDESSRSEPESPTESRNVRARSRTRQNSLYINSTLPGAEQGAQRLLKDALSKREWERFKGDLDKASRMAVKNMRKLEGSREWTSHVRGIGGRRRAGTCILPVTQTLQGAEEREGDPPRRRSEGTVMSKSVANKITQAQAIESSSKLRSLDAEGRKRLMLYTDSAYGGAQPDSATTSTDEHTQAQSTSPTEERGGNPLSAQRVRVAEPESYAEGEAIDSTWTLQTKPDMLGVAQNIGRELVSSKPFNAGISALIVLNALLMSVEHYQMDGWVADVLELSNIIFVSIFAFETVCKLFSLGMSEFVEDRFNVLDAVIVSVSLAELVFLSSSAATIFRVLRLARVVRVVKLARRWRKLQHIVKTVGSSMSYMGYLLLLLMLFIFVFGVLGRQLFAGKIKRCCLDSERATGMYNCYEDTDEYYIYDSCWNTAWKRTHFDSLYWSMVSVFQIVTQDNWTAVMYKAMTDLGGIAAVYFLVILLLGRYMILNLFVAILLVGLEREYNKRDEQSSAEGDACDDFDGVLDSDDSGEEECEYPPQVRYEEQQAQKELDKANKTAMRTHDADSPLNNGNGSFSSKWIAAMTPRRRASTMEPATTATPSLKPDQQRSRIPSFNMPKLKLGSLAAVPKRDTPLETDRIQPETPPPLRLEKIKSRGYRSPPNDPFGDWEAMITHRSENSVGATSEQPTTTAPVPEGSPKASVLGGSPGVAKFYTSINSARVPAGSPSGLRPRLSFADLPRAETDPMVPMTARTRRKFSRLRSQSLFKQLNGDSDSEDDEGLEGISVAPVASGRLRRLSIESYPKMEEKSSPPAEVKPSPEAKFTHILSQPVQSKVASYMHHHAKPKRYPNTEVIKGREVAFRRDIFGLYDWQAVVVHPNGMETEVLLGRSWGVFSPDNTLRMFLWKVVDGTFFPFEKVIGYLIFFSCAALVINEKTVGHSHLAVALIETFDLMFTVIFLFEILIRITVYTFASHEAGKSAYVRRARWNWLDCLIVLISVVMLPLQYMVKSNVALSGIAATVYKVARALRAWRPLRILVRSQNMQIVIGALVGTIPAVFNVFAVASVSYFMFGVASVQLFKGSFMACNDGSNRTYEECDSGTMFSPPEVEPFTSWVNDSYVVNTTYPTGARLFRRSWENIYPFNFNNIGHSLLTLLQCAILNGWTEVLYAVVDSSYVEDGATIRMNQELMGLLVVLWVFFGGLCIMNVFVGCVVDYFSRLKTRLDRSAFLTKNQMQALRIKKILANQKAKHRLVHDDNAHYISRVCYSIVSHNLFAAVVVIAICLNVLIMTTIHYEQTEEWTNLQTFSNLFFSALFTAEMVLKIGVAGPRVYLATTWNRLDGFIVITSWLEVVVTEFITHGNAGSVVQLFRLGRIFRLIRHFKGLKKLFLTMYYSVPALLNVGSLLVLVFFISGVTAMVFFESIRKVEFNDNYLNPHYNFDTFPLSILTLYRVSTFDNWRQVLRACLIHPPQCSGDECGATSAYQALLISLFFSAFVLTVGFVMFNLFIAVVLENFQESVLLPPPLLAKMELVKMFREKWAYYDPTAVQIIKAYNFVPLMMTLPSPIGFMDCEQHEILPSLLHLDFPVTKDSDILFMDVIDAIGETVFKIKLVDREAAKQHMSTGKRDVVKDKERYELGFTIGDWYAACTIQIAWRQWRGVDNSERHPELLTGNLMEDLWEKSYRRFPEGRPQGGVKKGKMRSRWALTFRKAKGGAARQGGRERSDTLLSIFSRKVQLEVENIRKRDSMIVVRTGGLSSSSSSSSTSSACSTPLPQPVVPSVVPPITRLQSPVLVDQVSTPSLSLRSSESRKNAGEDRIYGELMSTLNLNDTKKAKELLTADTTLLSPSSKGSGIDAATKSELLKSIEQVQTMLDADLLSPMSIKGTDAELGTVSSFTFSPDKGGVGSPLGNTNLTFNLSETAGTFLRRPGGFAQRHAAVTPPPPIQVPEAGSPTETLDSPLDATAPMSMLSSITRGQGYVPWPSRNAPPASPVVESPSPKRRVIAGTSLYSPMTLRAPQLRASPAAPFSIQSPPTLSTLNKAASFRRPSQGSPLLTSPSAGSPLLRHAYTAGRLKGGRVEL